MSDYEWISVIDLKIPPSLQMWPALSAVSLSDTKLYKDSGKVTILVGDGVSAQSGVNMKSGKWHSDPFLVALR